MRDADAGGPGPQDVVALLIDRGLTIATGESLTAGLVAATLAEVPGCSAVLRGGVVAYDPGIKSALLGVSTAALSEGVVSQAVARAMARGARSALQADVGVGTTGVAGPDAHEGEPVGSVWIAVSMPYGDRAVHLALSGDRDQIRRQTVRACWDLVDAAVRQAPARE